MVDVQTSRRTAAAVSYRSLIARAATPLPCLAPVPMTLHGAPDPVNVTLGLDPDRKAFHDLEVRCRKCENCLRMRSNLWTFRAINETVIASRTWFGTLTLHPDQAFRFQLLAGRALQSARRETWAETSSDVRFQALARQVGPDLQKWLKRVRANSGAPIRYLLVCEAHKSGIPHWHCLIHEYGPKVGKRLLDRAWRLGHSQFRLVDEDAGAARYACKYLAKSALTRVRASRNYGTPPAAFILQSVSDPAPE